LQDAEIAKIAQSIEDLATLFKDLQGKPTLFFVFNFFLLLKLYHLISHERSLMMKMQTFHKTVLVIDQGTILDRIDYNIEQTQVHLETAFTELQKVIFDLSFFLLLLQTTTPEGKNH
jgi:t-SNARE complex subunit (syntaxin)